MTPYLICFVVTLVFAKFNERNKGIKLMCFLSAVVIILAPTILAGMRDISIGTDTTGYVSLVFKTALNSTSLSNCIHSTDYIKVEIGYVFLAYISSRLSRDIHVFLFFSSLIVQLMLYLSLNKMRKHISVFMGELIYLFLFYNATFNMARQSIALVFVLYAFSCLVENKKIIRVIVIMGIGYLFHHSIVISIPIFVIYMLFQKYSSFDEILNNFKRNEKKLMLIVFLVLVFAVLIVYENKEILNHLAMVGILGDKYTDLLSSSAGNTEILGYFVYSLPYITIWYTRKKEANKYFYLSIAILDSAFYSLQNTVFYFYRIALYFSVFKIFSLASYKASVLSAIKSGRFSREAISKLIVMISCVIYWYLFYVHRLFHETIPYAFFK